MGSTAADPWGALPAPAVSASFRARKEAVARELVRAAERSDNAAFTAALFSHPDASPAFDPADPEYAPALAMSLLWAAHTDNPELAQLVLDLGVHPDARPNKALRKSYYAGELKFAVDEGCTALMLAARRGHLNALRTLLRAHPPPDLSARDAHSWTALLRACWNGRAAAARLLLDAGADPGAADGSGWTGAMRAGWQGHAECVRMVVDAGGAVDAQDAKGQTALHLAALADRPEVAGVLLERGADVNRRDVHGLTPLDLARSRAHPDVRRLLERHATLALLAAPAPLVPTGPLVDVEAARPAAAAAPRSPGRAGISPDTPPMSPAPASPARPAPAPSFFDPELADSVPELARALASLRIPERAAGEPAAAVPGVPGGFAFAADGAEEADDDADEATLAEPAAQPVRAEGGRSGSVVLRAAEEGTGPASPAVVPVPAEEHGEMEMSAMPGAFDGSRAAREEAAAPAPPAPVEAPAPVDAPAPADPPAREPEPEEPLIPLLADLAGAPVPEDLAARLRGLARGDALVARHGAALAAVLREHAALPFADPLPGEPPAVPSAADPAASIPAFVEAALRSARELRARVERLRDEAGRVEGAGGRVDAAAVECGAAREEAEAEVAARGAERERVEEAIAGAERDFDALSASLAARLPATFDPAGIDSAVGQARSATAAELAAHLAAADAALAHARARAASLSAILAAAGAASDALAAAHADLHQRTAGALDALRAFAARARAYLAQLTALTEAVLGKLRRRRAQIALEAGEAAGAGMAARHRRLVEVEGRELEAEVGEGERLRARYVEVMGEIAAFAGEGGPASEAGASQSEASQDVAARQGGSQALSGSEGSTQPLDFVLEHGPPASQEPRLINLRADSASDSGTAAAAGAEEADVDEAGGAHFADVDLDEDVGRRAGSTEYAGSEAELASQLSDASFERIERDDTEE